MIVEYINHMGTDLTVVNAARVSFDKESEWYKEPDDEYGYGKPELELREKDYKLISYLAKHNHWTPFSHCIVTLRESVPIFVARQRFKHMVGFSYNEVSRRYVDDEPTFYQPKEWRGKPVNKKQGSSDEIIDKVRCWDPLVGPGPDWYDPSYLVDNHNFNSLCVYNSLIGDGVAPEQARMVLPQSMFTSYYVTGSLAAWARAYGLRSKEDAQLEIRDLASQWNNIISPLFPISWSALTNG
jgi:thymidylate synthase (FAD)